MKYSDTSKNISVLVNFSTVFVLFSCHLLDLTCYSKSYLLFLRNKYQLYANFWITTCAWTCQHPCAVLNKFISFISLKNKKTEASFRSLFLYKTITDFIGRNSCSFNSFLRKLGIKQVQHSTPNIFFCLGVQVSNFSFSY